MAREKREQEDRRKTEVQKPRTTETPQAPRLFGGRRKRSPRANQYPPRRPPPPPKGDGRTRKPLCTIAQRTQITCSDTNAHCGRPRGRNGQPCRFHALHTGLAAHRAKTHVAPRSGGPDGGQPRCARGNPKESPKARTRMTKGQSGANAPDRNRGRPPSGPPGRGATYEAPSPPPTSPSYSSFPGFIIPLGSKTRLISRINRNSTASLLCRKCSRFSCPIPCSALMLPP